MRIALDVQHINKPAKPYDKGASYKRLTEAYAVENYFRYTRALLEEDGHEVHSGFFGSYRDRHEQVNRYDFDLYIAGHLNAGKGKYSLVCHTTTAYPRTRKIAEILLDEFCERLHTTKASTPIWELGPKDRGWSCIKHTKCSAILIEPLFIDNVLHHEMIISGEATVKIAEAIREAVRRWEI